MAFYKTNPNPLKKLVGDCTVRAVCIAMDKSWEDAYVELCLTGMKMCDMPSSNDVWGTFLLDNGFTRHIIPDTCPSCYTVKQFCREHPVGTFVLGTGTHAICVIDGTVYDTWDSSEKVPLFYFEKEE